MQRQCDVCQRLYEAKNSRSKFCDATCKMRNQRAKGPKAARKTSTEEPGLVTATRKALEAAGRVDTVAGQQALCIAEQMCGFGTGGAIASLSKELRTTLAEALGGTTPVAGTAPTSDPLDEVRARRDRKRAG